MRPRKIAPVTAGFEALKLTSVYNAEYRRTRDLQPLPGKDRCEWGHDEYSLNVANLPMAQKPMDAPSEDDRFAGEGT